MNKLKDRLDSMYNIEAEFLDRNFLYIRPMRSLVLTTRELLDFIALAEVQAEESKKLHSSTVYAMYC
jgi:hypothetical protein